MAFGQLRRERDAAAKTHRLPRPQALEKPACASREVVDLEAAALRPAQVCGLGNLRGWHLIHQYNTVVFRSRNGMRACIIALSPRWR